MRADITPIQADLAEHVEKLPLISTVLPYEFGGGLIDHLAVSCAGCGDEIGQESIRGEFETAANGQATKLKAYAVCYKCRTLTPVESRFHSDGTLLNKGSNGWIESEWAEKKTGFLKSFGRIITNRWQQVVPPLVAVVLVGIWFVTR